MNDIKNISDEQKAAVTKCIETAESKTSAEIVPVIANASGRYDRAEDLVGLWCTTFSVICLWYFMPGLNTKSGSWNGTSVSIQIFAMIAGIVLSFIGGAILADRYRVIRRLFTSKKEMQEEVKRKSRELFFDQRIHHTDGATGLLIYISLYEHMVELVADSIVVEKLEQSTLDEVCQTLTDELHRQVNPVDALCHVITTAGDRLGEVLPRAADDINELADALILID